MGSSKGCVQWFRLALERSEGMFVHLDLQLAFIQAELSLTCVRMAPVIMTSSLLPQSELVVLRIGVVLLQKAPVLLCYLARAD